MHAYLHPGLGQLGPGGQLLAHVHVRVVRLLEDLLQLVELRAAESGPVAPLLAARHLVVALVRRRRFVRLVAAAT